MFHKFKNYSVGYWPMEDQGGIFFSTIASSEEMRMPYRLAQPTYKFIAKSRKFKNQN
jgi:hypothetical protein